ncbi:MAG: polysaccharide deacetylase family protein [Lautropia sp.]
MQPHERVPYVPITTRPAIPLPGGARMAVWVIVNIEEWDIHQTMPRTVLTPPAGGAPMPDIPNWAWHEYGNRVGFWRLLEILDRHRVPAVLAINGTAIASYGPIAEAAAQREWEFIGHGYTQRNMQKVEDEVADIARTTEAIRAFTGQAPKGWLGPGLTETWQTPEHLVRAGYEYVCDWVLDDQPVWLRTERGPIVSVPYTQECNDVAMMLIQHHPAREYAQRALDQFTQLQADAAGGARVMALVLHPYIMGAPHRARYLAQVLEHIARQPDVAFCSGAQINAAFRSAIAPPDGDALAPRAG